LCPSRYGKKLSKGVYVYRRKQEEFGADSQKKKEREFGAESSSTSTLRAEGIVLDTYIKENLGRKPSPNSLTAQAISRRYRSIPPQDQRNAHIEDHDEAAGGKEDDQRAVGRVVADDGNRTPTIGPPAASPCTS
jgi:hypothetical protein